MSKNLLKIIELEDELNEILEDNLNKEDECEKIVSEIARLLEKLDNDELLYLMTNSDIIHRFIDITAYFKKYKINKKEIREKNSYQETFKKLNLFVERVRDVSICEEEYMYICQKCCVDDISNYLLSKMSNEEIMSLSFETDDWNYKLFLFGNLKV